MESGLDTPRPSTYLVETYNTGLEIEQELLENRELTQSLSLSNIPLTSWDAIFVEAIDDKEILVGISAVGHFINDSFHLHTHPLNEDEGQVFEY